MDGICIVLWAVRLAFGNVTIINGVPVAVLRLGNGICFYSLSTSFLPFLLPLHPFAIGVSGSIASSRGL